MIKQTVNQLDDSFDDFNNVLKKNIDSIIKKLQAKLKELKQKDGKRKLLLLLLLFIVNSE